MVIPYAEVGAEWWDAHFLSLDYGFGKSSASAHLHVRTQDGKIKTVGEFVAPHLPAYEFAAEVVPRLVAPLQPLDGSRGKQITNFRSEQIRDFHWSFDGSRLVLVRGHIESDVVLLQESKP